MLQALLAVFIALLIVELRIVIIIVFIAFLLTMVLRPFTARLQHWHVPTALAVLLPILGVLCILALIGFFIIPSFIHEAQQFANQLPSYFDKIKHSSLLKSTNINTGSLENSLKGHIGSLAGTFLSVTTTVAKIIAGIITIAVITLYWTATYDETKKTMLTYVPASHRERAYDIWTRMEKKLVHWVQAQVLLSVTIGVLVWLGALIIGLPYAAALGVISGLFESIPTLGAIAAGIPGVLLGLSISLKTAIAALIMYILVHQLENHIVVPLLYGRTVRLHPIMVIVSLLIGAELYGILGVLLAVPAGLCVSAFVDSFRGDDPEKLKKRPGAALSRKN